LTWAPSAARTARPTTSNDAGQIVGFAKAPDGNDHAFLWRDGAMTDLGTLGGINSRATALNNSGQVIGFSTTQSAAAAVPFLWQGGAMMDLGLGEQSTVVGINDARRIAGSANGRSFLWQDGVPTDLGDLGVPGVTAADINNAGQIAGTAATGGVDGSIGLPANHAFLWQDGAIADLGTPPFTMSSYAGAINNSGQVVGSMTVFVNTGYGAAVLSRAFFYDGSAMIQLPVPALSSWATDINDSGQVVGIMNGGAFIYEQGVVQNLNTLVPPGTPLISSATAINNSGQIVGSTSTGHAYLLDPNPPIAGPEVQVWLNGAEISDDSGAVSFGETLQATPVTRTFSIRNIGSEVLNLTSGIALPTGFTLVSGPGATSLAPGGVTTFVARLPATALGSFAGQISFNTNDLDEGTFNFAVSGSVPARVIDDGVAGFTSLGFTALASQGYQNDVRRASGGVGGSVATWTFGGLTPGAYRVSATWTAALDRATNAPFTVLNDSTPLATISINQEQLPDDFAGDGVTWEDLGVFTIDGSTLVVRLTNQANQFVIADAIRIEPIALTHYVEFSAPAPVPLRPITTTPDRDPAPKWELARPVRKPIVQRQRTPSRARLA
jgi:probable HAF family extracellular repeat protein